MARDGDGAAWHIREVDAAEVPGARAGRCLVLDRGDLVRRLWKYPRNWRELPLRELLDLRVT